MQVQRSRVGQMLSNLTTSRVIVGVLTLLLFIPCFNLNSGLYGDYPPLNKGGLQILHEQFVAEGNTPGLLQGIQVYQDSSQYVLVSLCSPWTAYISTQCQRGLCACEGPGHCDSLHLAAMQVTTTECATRQVAGCYISLALFDVKWNSQFNALLNIMRTLFIVVALAAATLLFNRDSDRLVLRPIERMIKKASRMLPNPLARQEASVNKGEDSQLETKILENSIHKICSLLAVGFGDAGAEVIANNIKSGGDLNPMIPGNKVVAIFGFCDIRNFTDTTEVLQEDIMEFVNSIADIVHTEVALHGGSPNKNIGDAFLLVWKFPKGFTHRELAGMLSATDTDLVQARNTADRALAAFIIIQAAIKRSSCLKRFCCREDLNARMPNYQVKMGFGLHVGWAIEGAIGSRFKIDASYLSPHVNMASRLEAATKQFGTSILVSEDFAKLLTPGLRRRVRQIDCVTVKGSNKPMGLFTYDVSLENVRAPDEAGQQKASYLALQSGPHESYSLKAMESEFREHPDLMFTWAVTTAFTSKFNSGFQAYLAGNWKDAKLVFEETKSLRRTDQGTTIIDGPSNTLLEVMKQHSFNAPKNWAGFRELTEK
eukprot:jgi/Astpho2/9900/e_gw1.00152.86.1_t